MQTKKKLSLIAFSGIALLMGMAIPVSGDFVDRKERVWSQDVVNSALNSYTQTLCVLNKLKPELNVNGEAYTAKVNFTACTPGGSSAPTDEWLIFKVKSMANGGDGYIAHVWAVGREKNSVRTDFSGAYYLKLQVSSSAPGDFKLESCSASNNPDSICNSKNFMQKIGSSLQVHANTEADLIGGWQGKSYFHLEAILNSESGYGSIKSSGIDLSEPNNFQENIDLDYAYSGKEAILNVIKYEQGDPRSLPLKNIYSSGAQCISRSLEEAKTTVFNYELFNVDGSRYVIDKPQIPYRVFDSNNRPVLDSAGVQIGGRIMWDDASNSQIDYLSVDKSVIVAKLKNGQALKAATWIGGGPNYFLNIRLNPANSNEFQILDIDGNPYKESPALSLRFTIKNDTNVGGLIDGTLDGTVQNLSYMGNGYIHGIKWDSVNGAGYYIKPGSEVTGVRDGKTYFVRPMFYSVSPSAKACSQNSLQNIANATTTRAKLPINPSFTGVVWKDWSDPRVSMGDPPSITSPYKYIDGQVQ